MTPLLLTLSLLGQTPSWAQIDKLVSEQKLEAAAVEAEKRLTAAKAGGDELEHARALIKVTQLRISLGGYETAVKRLREEPWPKGQLGQDAVNLYYANAIWRYAMQYSWEIRTREKVDTRGVVDLKQWTAGQLYAEMHRAYGEVWKNREALGTKPIAALAEYFTANDYPAGIRPTLRDAVTYLWAQALVNSTSWTPEQSNDLFRLDLKALVKGNAVQTGEVHPLAQAMALHDDLEAWHAKKGEREAALNARIERLQALHNAYTDAEPRELVRAELEARLDGVKDLPWSAQARAVLAELTRTAGDLVKARAIAAEGAKAYPKSIGGQRCASIVATIESPDYSITSMESDGAGKRSIEVSARNVPTLYFRAYRLDLISFVTGRSDYQMLPSNNEVKALMGKPAGHSFKVALPPTPDFKSHRTYVTPPMKDAGLWVVVASAREDFSDTANRLMAVNFVVTRLVMVVRHTAETSLDITITDGATGTPLPGVTVELWSYRYDSKRRKEEGLLTNAEGSVKFGKEKRPNDRQFFVVAKKGKDEVLENQSIGFYAGTTSEFDASLIYTDRSVYRPQQKLLWKVVAYHGNADRTDYQTSANKEVTVSLMDPNHQVVETKKIKTNGFGSAAGEFVIPTGRLLGQWSLQTNGGTSYVRVEEYKRPTFSVELKDTGKALKLNAAASLKGEARYYFGLPVTSGQVKWRVQRTPQWPGWWGWWGWNPPASRAQVVASGTSAVKPDGTFEVTFTPEADPKLARDVTYRYQVDADLTDEGGETRSATKTTRLGLVSVEARSSIDGEFLRDSTDAKVTSSRTDLDGNPRAGKGSFKVVVLTALGGTVMPSDEPIARSPVEEKTDAYRSAGDSMKPRWGQGWSWMQTVRTWKEGAQVAAGELTHDDKGVAVSSLGKLKAGAYRFKYETKDEAGEKFETSLDFLVAGGKFELKLPALLLTEKTSVKVGQTARFLVGSGFENQPVVIEVYRGGKRVDRKVVTGGKDGSFYERPVTAEDRGGFSVQVLAVRDWQLLQFQSSIFVPWDNKQLDLSFSTFRDTLRPGQKETFTVSVKANGKALEAGAAEVLAYMFDQSLDLFGPHSPPNVISLYASRTGVPWLTHSLNTAGPMWLSYNNWFTLPGYPQLRADQLVFFESYGVGGMGLRGRGTGGGGYAAETRRMARSESKSDSMASAEMAVEGAAAPAPPPMAPPEKSEKAKPAAQTMAQAANKVGGEESKAVEVRSNFAETAFFIPQLITDAKGTASFEFQVPDSVTAWNVWAHAMTKDLRGGSTKTQAKSVKELMVRPYLPRFLREGDAAAIKVVVNNASKSELKGELMFEIFDPDTNADLSKEFSLMNTGPQPFSVKAGEGASLTFPIVAPKRVGTVAIRVVAKSGDFSDGELRPMPLLPSRMHLAQSKFVTLRDAQERKMTFADLAKNDDPSRINEQLVVTVDAQLFFTVLQALPYLARYPYECTEQTMNRFVSSGIVGSVFRDHPAVAKMAAGFVKRTTPLETFDAMDPNRKLTLEESPWVMASKGGAADQDFINMLDPKVVSAEQASALTKLRKAQTSGGGFPWFAGGPPSPYITLYLAHGFAKAAEFKVDVPKDVVQRAWQYLASEYRGSWKACMALNGCWEFVTFLNYVASSYPDESWTNAAFSADERRQMLEFSFRHWKKHSPYLKGYLALTLQRMKRPADAKLVFDSVMDSAKTTQDDGTFWQPEDRAWLWYNDTIESHAFALRALTELSPKDTRRDGLVQWLLINKKLNQWKSTRATAEVIYSLVKYMQSEKTLGIREESLVSIGPIQKKFEFAPDEYTGKKNQLVVPGPQIDGKTMSTVTVSKTTKGFQFASATWHFSTDKLPTEARGDLFQVSRTYFKRLKTGKETTLQPLTDGAKLEPGDELEVQLSIKARAQAEYVHLRDPRGAGFEPEGAVSRYRWDLGLSWYEEYRDSGTNFFFENLPAGQYTFKYRVRANLGGTFRVGPATLQSMYAPEFTAYSQGHVLTVATGGK